MQMPNNFRYRNALLALGCALMATHLSYSIYQRYLSANARPGSDEYKVGMSIVDTDQLGLAEVDHTVLLLEASTCHFCKLSMPFYRRLTATARSSGARVVAVTYENPDENRAYLSAQGVEVDADVSNVVNSLPIEGTPTLVLVGRDGKVINSWLGKLTEGEETSVLGAISPGK